MNSLLSLSLRSLRSLRCRPLTCKGKADNGFLCLLRLLLGAFHCLPLSPCLFCSLRLSPCVLRCLRRCLVCFLFRFAFVFMFFLVLCVLLPSSVALCVSLCSSLPSVCLLCPPPRLPRGGVWLRFARKRRDIVLKIY